MKRLPTVRVVFDRKHVATKTNKGLVQLEVLYEKKRKWISTGVKVYSDQWDARKWVVNSMDSARHNRAIFDQKDKLENWLTTTFNDAEAFSWEKLDAWLDRSKNNVINDNFIDFCEMRIAERKDITEHTRKMQGRLVKSLKEFGQIMWFSDLTKTNIIRYHEWLKGKYSNDYSIYDYIKYLRTYVNEALRMEYIDKYPFTGLKFKRGEPRSDKFLTEDEVRKIIKEKIQTDSLSNVRDLFVVQCYTGLSFSDLMAVDFKKAVKHGDHYVLSDERKKTGQGYYIVLLKPVMEILKLHDFRLPKMTNQQYNMRLKIVADSAGVDKQITSHYGRRTCGYLLLNNGFSIELVAKVLGHANIKTTQAVYAKILNPTLDKAFSDLEKKMNTDNDTK